jgi:hypothetical protein
MYCSGCGGSIATEAIFCSLCGTRQPLAQALALPQQQIAQATTGYFPAQRSYRWGKFHGWFLIFWALFLLRTHPSEIMVFSTVFLVVLGICVLRRNRLILPLMVAWPAIQFFWYLGHPGYVSRGPLFPLVVWCFYFVYYYRRKDEFVTWL